MVVPEALQVMVGRGAVTLRFSAAMSAPPTALQLLATPAIRVTLGAAVRAVQVGRGVALTHLL